MKGKNDQEKFQDLCSTVTRELVQFIARGAHPTHVYLPEEQYRVAQLCGQWQQLDGKLQSQPTLLGLIVRRSDDSRIKFTVEGLS